MMDRRIEDLVLFIRVDDVGRIWCTNHCFLCLFSTT